LVASYGRLVFHWCLQAGLNAHDTEDVGQEVFFTVLKRIGDFEKRQQPGSFRAWLRGITIRKMKERHRHVVEKGIGGSSAQEWLAQVPADSTGESTNGEKQTEDRIILRGVLESIRGEFKPQTYGAALRVLLDGQKPSAVAQELGITPNAVSIARYRVLSRLRELMVTLP
jgi:RNA polymerase sigma-70 factor (ECF subfamily)